MGFEREAARRWAMPLSTWLPMRQQGCSKITSASSRVQILGSVFAGLEQSTRHVDVFTFRRHDVDNPFIAERDVGRQAAGEPVAQFSIRKAGILEKWRVLFVTSTASSAGQVPRIR
jgi:hypothetical protein